MLIIIQSGKQIIRLILQLLCTPEIWTGWMKLLSPKIRPPSGLAKRLMNYNLGQGTCQPRRSLWGQQRSFLALYWGLTSLSASFPGKGRAMQEHYQEQSLPSFPYASLYFTGGFPGTQMAGLCIKRKQMSRWEFQTGSLPTRWQWGPISNDRKSTDSPWHVVTVQLWNFYRW